MRSHFYAARASAPDERSTTSSPWSRSGDDGLENLVAACGRCNNHKLRHALDWPSAFTLHLA
ncbi:MAG: HNH endonuclease [Solirubrobacteraceae bacterium]